MYPIIDCHCHIYPDKIAVKASQNTGAFYDMDMNYDGKLSTLTRLDEVGHISHSVVFSVATTPKQARVCEKKLDNKLELQLILPPDTTASALKCILFSCNKHRD